MIYLGPDDTKSAANGAAASKRTKTQVSRRNWCWITMILTDFFHLN
jgi:hypothetical protein